MIGALFTQSEYSLLDNTISIEKLVKRAKEYKYEFLSLADNNTTSGLIPFYKECIKENIKPVLGIYASLESLNSTSNKMLFYALNKKGYQNILKISSTINILEEPLMPFAKLEEVSEGVYAVCTMDTDIVSLLISGKKEDARESIRRYKSIFKHFALGISIEDLRFEVIAYDYVNLALEEEVPLLPLKKVSYLNKDGSRTLRYLRAIGTGHLENEIEEDYSFYPLDKIESSFMEYPYVFDYLDEFLSLVSFDLKEIKAELPKYPTPNNVSSKDYLDELAHLGLKRRLELNNRMDKAPIYIRRLEYELSVISKMSFDDYFLIVFDFVRYAKKNKILVGPGRGSAAGSLVSYSLGITEVDPILYNLLFERFLNPERVSMPDIDLDFPDDKRDEVIKYVCAKYGKTRVAHIETFGTFQARLAIRDVAKVMKIPSYKVDSLLKYIPSGFDLREYKKNETLLALSTDEEIERLLEVSSEIFDLPKNISTHAAGIILSDLDLWNYVALQKGVDEVYQTQALTSDLEGLGLLKIDFLGLRNLKMIDEIRKMIDKEIDLNHLPLNDKKTFDLLKRADTSGVFQLESQGIRNVLRRLSPDSFEDIVAILALYRPGPMDNIDEFIRRRNGKAYHVPKRLEEILKPTYGIILYQEQIMLIAQKFAGYTLGEADILRRAVSKKKRDVLEEEREKFIKKSLQNGYDLSTSKEIYEYIVRFADYGFNRNHSVAYAMIAYQMAYLKAHYPNYFMIVLLNGALADKAKTEEYIKDCIRYGIKIRKPDINKSGNAYYYQDGIIYPLLGIKNIGAILSDAIIEERKKRSFSSIVDFRRRVKISDIALENLVFAGCFDFLQKTKKELLSTEKSMDFFEGLMDEIEIDKEEYPSSVLREKEIKAIGFLLSSFSKEKGR